MQPLNKDNNHRNSARRSQAKNSFTLAASFALMAGVAIGKPHQAIAMDAIQMHYFNVVFNLLEEAEAKRLKGNYKEICSIATDLNTAMRPYPGAKGFTSVLKGWRLLHYSKQEYMLLVAKMKAMCPSGYFFR